MKQVESESAAKALEIAVTLTKADHEWLTEDEEGRVLMREPLYSTFKKVIKIIAAENMYGVDSSECQVLPANKAPRYKA